jgi:hypothetical protein
MPREVPQILASGLPSAAIVTWHHCGPALAALTAVTQRVKASSVEKGRPRANMRLRRHPLNRSTCSLD